MPGAMRKLGLYLGLVEDDADRRGEWDDADYQGQYPGEAGYDEQYDARGSYGYAAAGERAPEAPVGVGSRVRSYDPAPRTIGATAVQPHAQLRPAPVPAVDEPYRITTLHPRTYNEARTIGEHFREGTPVIMNLTEMDDTDAKRLVDFAAGLIFGLRGSIERVTNKVFLLSPANVEVTAEDKARIAEGGFFNQS